ncbi:MAG: hypothetical protein ACREQ9_17035, partial [Candidatus Binatia bacterium]
PVACYVTFLAALDLHDDLRRRHGPFFAKTAGRTKPLDDLLARIPEIRASLPFAGSEDGEEFLSWFETSFLSSAEATR